MSLFYRQFGSGRPLVFLHGLFGSGDNWQTLLSKLEGFEVWLPDLRNHGASPWFDDFSVQELATDLYDFLDEHKIERPLVGGHSLGGKTAMEFALSWPERLSGMICVDMAPRAYAPQYDGFVSSLLEVNLETIHSRSEAQNLLATRIPDKATLLFLLKNLVPDEKGTGWRWRLNLKALEQHYDQIWIGLNKKDKQDRDRVWKGPALFVAGGQSEYVRAKDWPLILDFFPQAELQTIEGAGHWLHAEKPAEVLTVIRRWLDQKNDFLPPSSQLKR
ncbi:MAG: alpha/beta fold hydrolase [Spirochaetales bacterium]|nr:alpha/beta fold hydrolase [Spirochaetales bacterium]